MKKIFISDLDGTLLNEKAELSNYTKMELQRLIKEQNLNFTIATARNINTIQRMFSGVDLKLPVIEFNGSFITDFRTGEKLIVNSIDISILSDFLKLCDSYNQFPMISSFNGRETNLYYKNNVSHGMDLYLDDRRKQNPNTLILADDDEYLKQSTICLTLIDKKENLDELVDKIKNLYGQYLNIYYNEDIYYNGWYWASIYSVNATKSNAVKSLLSYLNMSDYCLTVFGDHTNDIDMFEIADNAIAVENGEETLKSVSTQVIGKNIDDSVVKYMSCVLN